MNTFAITCIFVRTTTRRPVRVGRGLFRDPYCFAGDASGTGGLTIASSNSFRVSCGCPSDQDDMQLLGEPEPLLGSRAVWGGVIFVFGIFSLCFALWLKLTGRRKKFRQQQLKFARVGSAEDSL